ncbi:hypothetical protein [Kitasatospora cineracea]|uniref:Uncharacterized protein n=1 Tax=Kitasatospora cineracea TaxID=88074 RepID=A0A3N4RQ35_9ACTN|nr:hypothetical protein [Kitasatospora cineracea]RPE34936.1 hypothetical protein EDD38_3278 [Kitasatospora cineracea]
MTYAWPNKIIAEFTDDELADAIQQNETDRDPVTRGLVRDCTSEWERRRGINA